MRRVGVHAEEAIVGGGNRGGHQLASARVTVAPGKSLTNTSSARPRGTPESRGQSHGDADSGHLGQPANDGLFLRALDAFGVACHVHFSSHEGRQRSGVCGSGRRRPAACFGTSSDRRHRSVSTARPSHGRVREPSDVQAPVSPLREVDRTRCPSLPVLGTADPFAAGRCQQCRAVIEDPAWTTCPKCGASLTAPPPA